MSNFDESLDDGEYHSLSVLAIAALIFGLASVVSLISELLWVVPLIGLITGLAAIASIRRSGGNLQGRTLAQIGIALSLFFGLTAATQLLTTQRIVATRAQYVAQQWFAALARNEPAVALQLERSPARRAQLTDPQQLAEYYETTTELRRELREYTADPIIQKLLALNGGAEPRLRASTKIITEHDGSLVDQSWIVRKSNGKPSDVVEVDLRLARVVPPARDKIEWRIVKVTPPGGLDRD
jgi:hypothetical protein